MSVQALIQFQYQTSKPGPPLGLRVQAILDERGGVIPAEEEVNPLPPAADNPAAVREQNVPLAYLPPARPLFEQPLLVGRFLFANFPKAMVTGDNTRKER